MPYTQELLNTIHAGGDAVGIIALSCPREVYRLLAASGLPTVVSGSLYAGDPLLPSIDMDNREGGRLLAQYLIGRGHRRLALLELTDTRPGDNDFLDGISETLAAAKLPYGTMVTRSLPYERNTVSAATRDLLRGDDPPTGFIVHTEEIADIVASLAIEMDRKVPDEVEAVFYDFATQEVDTSSHAHVQSQLPVDMATRLIAKTLANAIAGKIDKDHRVILPVELRTFGQRSTADADPKHGEIPGPD